MSRISEKRYRHLAAAGTLAIAVAAVIDVAAQAPKPAATPTYTTSSTYVIPKQAYVPPKTPWGDPDISGVYDYQSMIPMQRPADLAAAGKKTFTPRELIDWAKAHTPNQDQCGYGTKANEDCSVRQLDNVGGYNEFWDTRKIVPDNRTSLIEDPEDGRMPAMNAEGRRKLQEYRKIHPQNADEGAGGNVTVHSWDDFPGITRCIAEQTPNGVQMYNSGTDIVQTPGWVTIVRERLDTRIIPIDGRGHIDDKVRQWNGDSRGHWEGNVLVVDTTNFTDKQAAGGVGATVPAGVLFGGIHVVEHFVPVSRDKINYYATIEDKTTWDKPWTFMLPWQRDDTYKIYEYACNEGNISVGNAIRGTAHIEDPTLTKPPVEKTTAGLIGSTEAQIKMKFGQPIGTIGPRLEYETIEGQPVYIYVVDGKVTQVRPNDLMLDQVKAR